MKPHSVFDWDDYRAYLLGLIQSKPSRGFRSALADAIGCQRTFISQVLKGTADFSLEHSEAISQFLGHTEDEADFFLMLVLHSRAGNRALKARIKRKLQTVREQRRILKNRFKEAETLSLEDQVIYYSSWIYGAIRVILTIPEYRTKEKIAKHLQADALTINKAFEFLLTRGLIEERSGEFFSTQKHMYLGNDSALISRHHINWRMRAIYSIDHERDSDLHYSSVISLSAEDVARIRNALTSTLETIRKTVNDSREECLYSLCADFFEV